MESCLQNPNCRKELEKTYEKMLITVVIAWYPDLLKKINNVSNLVISNDTTSSFFSGMAVDHLNKTISPECKSTIHPFTRFPFFYEYQGDTEAEGRYLNMNCFFVDYEQYKNLQKCISSEYFNIYSKKSKEILVEWTEKVCKKNFGIKWQCQNQNRTRIDTVEGNIICYKQTNKVYDAFVEIAKMDQMSQNGGKIVNDLFRELSAEGTGFKNTCIPFCESCSSYEKCNECKPQYVLVNNKCIKCEDNSKGCLTCKENQVLYKNECLEQCPLESVDQNRVCIDVPGFGIIKIVIILIIAFILLNFFVFVIFHKCCKNKTKYIQPEIPDAIQINNIQLPQQQFNYSDRVTDISDSSASNPHILYLNDENSNSQGIRFVQVSSFN